MKRIIFSSVALVFCALMITGAIFQLQSDRVECGGETMRQGDICVSKSRSGRVTESTLEESKTAGKVGAIAGIVIGALGILIAAQNLKIGIRNRKAAKGFGGPGADILPSPLQQFAAYPPAQQDFAQQDYAQPGFPQQNQSSQHQSSQHQSPQQHQYPPQDQQPYSPAQGFPQQAQPQYPPQQQYAPQQEYPPQQRYHQPPQHQYYQPPGPGDAQR